MRGARRLAAVGLAGALLTGCGGVADPPHLSPEAARVLGDDVDAVAAAARSQDVAALRGALQALRGHVEHYRTLDEVSAERASRILAAAARVATDVQPPDPVPEPAPPAPAPPAPAPPAPVRPPAPAQVEDVPEAEPQPDDGAGEAEDRPDGGKDLDERGKGTKPEKAGKGPGKGGKGSD